MKTSTWIKIGVGVAALALTAGCAGPSPTASNQRNPERVVGMVTAEAALGRFPATIRELAKSPEVVAVVQGTITSVRYVFADEVSPMTAITVRVALAKGTAATEVTAWEYGGLIPLSAHSADDRARMVGGDTFASANDQAVIDYRPFGGAEHPRVGEQVVLFLASNPNGGEISGGYLVVGGAYGRFERDSLSGSFTRAARDDATFERTISVANLVAAMS